MFSFFLLCCVLTWFCWWVAPWAILAHRRNLNWNPNLELSPTSPPYMGDAAQGNAKAPPCCCRHQSWCWPRLAKCYSAEATELLQQCDANVVHHHTQVKAWDGLPKVLPLQVLEPNFLEPELELPYMLIPASARACPPLTKQFQESNTPSVFNHKFVCSLANNTSSKHKLLLACTNADHKFSFIMAAHQLPACLRECTIPQRQ